MQPPPVWNESCHNDKVWNNLELPSTASAFGENITKFVCLFVLSFGTIISNVVFVLVLMNRRYTRNIFPQVSDFYYELHLGMF